MTDEEKIKRAAQVDRDIQDIGAFMQEGDYRVEELQAAVRSVWRFVKDLAGVE